MSEKQNLVVARPVVLCDSAGTARGTCEREAAHRSPGQLHLAFSVFVFRDHGGQLLIQQRHDDKLFGSQWANSCCSHPRPAERDVVAAATSRLQEECGFSVPLRIAGSFVYQAEDPRGRGAEYEHDTVLLGHFDDRCKVDPNPAEVARWKWIAVDQLRAEMQQFPARFAPWLAPALEIALAHLTDHAS